ncbi:MAG: RNA-directed DNA polymerase, partial [Pseudomonadota bacterium]
AQIEPFWNAYYLALVIQLAGQIESERVEPDEGVVFSYRYDWQEEAGKIFADSSWRDYRTKSLELSSSHKYVVVTDVADFYPRIYHHRIENALKRLDKKSNVPRKIMKLLKSFSRNVSYGLPVGGPASRILAELSLAATDKLLLRERFVYCRYADDFSIFCNDRAQAYRALVRLSEGLFNEGLVLQKTKTRILSAEEFIHSTNVLGPAAPNGSIATEEQKLLNVSLRYDPYSDTAVEDYEALKGAIKDIDILGILGREVAKNTIDPTVTKQAIRAISALSPTAQHGAVRTLLENDNLEVLSPVFVSVMRSVRGVYDDLPESGKDFVDNRLIELYENDSHLLSVDLNLGFYVQVLERRQSRRKEEIFIETFEKKTNPMIKRLIIQAMSNWSCHYWLTDLKRTYAGLTEWEKRYFVYASYELGDEGKYWRDNAKASWTPMTTLFRDWVSSSQNARRSEQE